MWVNRGWYHIYIYIYTYATPAPPPTYLPIWCVCPSSAQRNFQEATNAECGHDTLDAELMVQYMVLFLTSAKLFSEHGTELA